VVEPALTYTTLANIWAQVLGVDHVSPDADFWALGGDSLAAIRVAALAGKALGLEAQEEALLLALFEERTFADFAYAVESGSSVGEPQTT
jgi:acyl carrier protein